MKIKQIIIFSLLAFILFPSGIFAVEYPASVSIQPQTTSIAVGAKFSIKVVIDKLPQNKGISGFDLCLTFNPAVLKVDAISGPNTFIELKKSIDSKKGVACGAYVIVTADENLPKMSQLSVYFTGLSTGTTALAVGNAEIIGNIENNAYAPKIKNGTVTVIPVESYNGFAALIRRFLDFLSRLLGNRPA